MSHFTGLVVLTAKDISIFTKGYVKEANSYIQLRNRIKEFPPLVYYRDTSKQFRGLYEFSLSSKVGDR